MDYSGYFEAINEKQCNCDVLSLFSENVGAQEEFLNEITVSKFISSIKVEDIEDLDKLKSEVKIISGFEPIITKGNLREVIAKFTELLESENQKDFREEKENLLDCLYGLTNVFGDRFLKLERD